MLSDIIGKDYEQPGAILKAWNKELNIVTHGLG